MRYLFLSVLLVLGFWACQPEEACISSATSRVVLDFFRINQDSVVRDTLAFQKIYSTTAKDSVFWQNSDPSRRIWRVNVALNPDLDSTIFVFERQGRENDSLVLRYERRYRLISPECPLEVSFRDLTVAHSTFPNAVVLNTELETRPSLETDVQVFTGN